MGGRRGQVFRGPVKAGWSTILERGLQQKCVNHLKENGIYTLNIHGSGWGGKGRPDIIICLDGKFVAFELKVGDNQLSPAQRIHKRKIEDCGGLHFTPRTLEEFINILEGLK